MKSSNKILIIVASIVLLGALSGIFFSVINDNKDLELAEPVLTDDKGRYKPEELFEQSEETLRYAGHIDVSGDVTCYKMLERWFDIRIAGIKFSRDYADLDNYNGELNVEISNLENHEGGQTWRYVYKSSVGKIDSKAYRYFNSDGRCGTEGITHPNIEPILFPDISECDISFEKKKKGKGRNPDTIVYQVTLSGNIDKICKATRSLVGYTTEPVYASYIFDADTHVLSEINIYSEPSSLNKYKGEDTPLFYMNLVIDKYEPMALKSLPESVVDSIELK